MSKVKLPSPRSEIEFSDFIVIYMYSCNSNYNTYKYSHHSPILFKDEYNFFLLLFIDLDELDFDSV